MNFLTHPSTTRSRLRMRRRTVLNGYTLCSTVMYGYPTAGSSRKQRTKDINVVGRQKKLLFPFRAFQGEAEISEVI